MMPDANIQCSGLRTEQRQEAGLCLVAEDRVDLVAGRFVFVSQL